MKALSITVKVSCSFSSHNSGEEVEFNQPWALPNMNIIENIEDINQNERYLISNFSWSPGELCFSTSYKICLAYKQALSALLRLKW